MKTSQRITILTKRLCYRWMYNYYSYYYYYLWAFFSFLSDNKTIRLFLFSVTDGWQQRSYTCPQPLTTAVPSPSHCSACALPPRPLALPVWMATTATSIRVPVGPECRGTGTCTTTGCNTTGPGEEAGVGRAGRRRRWATTSKDGSHWKGERKKPGDSVGLAENGLLRGQTTPPLVPGTSSERVQRLL